MSVARIHWLMPRAFKEHSPGPPHTGSAYMSVVPAPPFRCDYSLPFTEAQKANWSSTVYDHFILFLFINFLLITLPEPPTSRHHVFVHRHCTQIVACDSEVKFGHHFLNKWSLERGTISSLLPWFAQLVTWVNCDCLCKNSE